MDRGKLGATGPEFVAFDLDGGFVQLAMDYPAGDLQLHAAGVVQHGGPVYGQPHFLALLERLLGGEPHFAAADLERLAYPNGEDPATLHALVADVLLYGKPEPRAPPMLLA